MLCQQWSYLAVVYSSSTVLQISRLKWVGTIWAIGHFDILLTSRLDEWFYEKYEGICLGMCEASGSFGEVL